MFSWLVTTLALSLTPPVAAPDDTRVAFDTNISLGACEGGGELLSVGAGTDVVVRGTYRGDDEGATKFSSWCPGFYPSVAQYCFNVPPGGAQYNFTVLDSQGVDTVMAVVPALDSYAYCDDDTAGGMRPMLDLWLYEGQHVVYIGSYSSGGMGTYELRVAPTVY
jgi:hypothetical protein